MFLNTKDLNTSLGSGRRKGRRPKMEVVTVKRFLTIAVVTGLFFALAAPAGAHSGGPGSPVGPPDGVFWANDVAYESAVTPAHVPNKGPFDAFYVFPDCPTCAPVSDAAPGVGAYNGGRWAVFMVTIPGITPENQPTNAADVLSAETGLVDTGHRFVCPLIRIVD